MKNVLIFLFCVTTLASKPRILGGEDAELGQFPWHVGVASVPDIWNIHLCSGAIINENWILTTASCINGATVVGIHAGSIDNEGSDGIIKIGAKGIIHENFDNGTLNNDIALIYLQSGLTFDDNIQPITLAEEELKPGVEAVVAGWGHSDKDNDYNRTSILQYTSVFTVANFDCQNTYGKDVVSDGVVCTVGGDILIHSPCVGDGGAPLITDFDTNPVLVGLFSFIGAPGCETGIPAGYTRVAYYKDWIAEKMSGNLNFV